MYFRSQDHIIANSQKPDTLDKKVHQNTDNTKTRAYISKKIDNMSENSTNKSDSQKIYVSMALMSSNTETPRRDFGESSKLTNWVLD